MLHCNSEQCPLLWRVNINNQDRIRLDTFIKKANGTVMMERVMEHGQSTDDF